MAKIDHVLKLYAETIRSPYLHYGLWENPETVDVESTTLSEIRDAQERYIVHLADLIPAGVKTVLDAGCGIGGNTAFLKERGFEVEALSPDSYQEELFHQKFNSDVKFYRTRFESFETQKKYDLILMSESAAYIRMESGIEKAWHLLSTGGYWLVSDYFVSSSDGGDSPHLKSAHRLDRYLEAAKSGGFDLIVERDITENVMPTLDAAYHFYNRFIVPMAEYASHSATKNAPKLSKLFKLVYGKKIRQKMDQVDYLKSSEFRKYRKYMVLLFQKGER
jgi:MPBQ/MSBQ methyltransferase